MTHLVEVLLTSKRYLCVDRVIFGFTSAMSEELVLVNIFAGYVCRIRLKWKGPYNGPRCNRRINNIKISRIHTIYCTLCYIMYLLFKNVLRRRREARNVRKIVISFLSAIASVMFPHFSIDLNYFANSFSTHCRWRNLERIFSAVHVPVVPSKSESKIGR